MKDCIITFTFIYLIFSRFNFL